MHLILIQLLRIILLTLRNFSTIKNYKLSDKKVILNTIYFDRLSSSQKGLVHQNNLIHKANKLLTDFAQNNKSSTILIDISVVSI